MKVRNKIFQIILFFICVTFFSTILFAQDIQAIKSEIYSKLRDRRCNMSLDKCNCPDAKEMKGYIDALLEMGASRNDIFYKVAKKFSLKTIIDEKVKADVERRLIKEAGKKHPQAILEPASFDFGQVIKKQGKISKVFRLTNKGNAVLIIGSLKTSCPCASVALQIDKNKTPYFGTEGSPKYWQAVLKSGETAELELMVDLASAHVKAGKLFRDATIISNDPVYPETSVWVEAEVIY